jgi:threonyl-tRNA synthetase
VRVPTLSGTRPSARSLARSWQAGLPYELQPGEGAFYGPKIEFTLERLDLGRLWQCGTIAAGFCAAGALGAEYVAEDGGRHAPVMLHRAILGSLERFIGILIENHAGFLPLWLAPTQLVVMNITDSQAEYTVDVANRLRRAGFRVAVDLRNEKITYKIREHSMQRLPYQLILGEKEKAAGMVAVRTRQGEDLGQITIEALIERLNSELPR